MAKASIFIVEDDSIQAEGLALQLLKAGYEISGIADNGITASSQILTNHPDILLVDIELIGNMDGISLVKKIEEKLGRIIPVIFTTKLNDQITVKRATKTRPVSYLTKPFNFHQLSIALETSIRIASLQKVRSTTPNNFGSPYLLNESAFIKVDHIFHRIPIQDIVLVEAQRQYSSIFTMEKVYLQSFNLEVIMKKLDHPDIIRIHRSFLINIQHIQGITGRLIQLPPKKTLALPEAVQKLGNKVPLGDKFRSQIINHIRTL